MPHRKFSMPLRPSCIPSKMGNSNAPRLEHMAHAPHITILAHLLMRNQFNLCSNILKTSQPPIFNAKWTPAERTIISTNKYIKNTYLIDFPPQNNPRNVIKLSKLWKAHVFTSTTCFKWETQLSHAVKDQTDHTKTVALQHVQMAL